MMMRFIKFFIGLLLVLNLFLLVFFLLPVRTTLNILAYGTPGQFEYVDLGRMSNDLKKVFWHYRGQPFFEKKPITLKNIITMIWDDRFKNDPGRPFDYARSHITHFLLDFGQHNTLWQKLHATVFLIKVHKMMSPESAMEVYLNMLPLGEGFFGVELASQ